MNRTARAVLRFFRHRQHPLKIISYTSKNLWLLLIPLAKYLIASHFNFQAWVRANWVDLLTIILIVGFAVLRWIFISFNIEPDGIQANTGFFGMVRTKVYFSQLTSVSFCQKWYSRPFKAHTVYMETNAKTVSAEDLRLVISKRNADLLYQFISSSSGNKPKVTYSPKKSHLFIFSLLFSSALTGVVLYGTFMFEAYRILGLETEQEMLRRVNGEFDKLDSKFLNLTRLVPRAVLLLAGIVIFSWLISFLATLARHWSFTVSRTKDQFFIQSGVLLKRRHIINKKMVNYYDLTQTLLMKIFRICSVTLDCTGYGKSRREINALIPVTTYRQMNVSLRLLVPDIPLAKPEIRTGTASDVRRFVTMPILLCLIPPTGIKLLERYVIDWNREINALLVILTVPLLWLVIVKAAAAFNTSAGFDDVGCVLNYCKWYQFHKIFLPKSSISKIRITRNPFQLMNNTCTLCIYTVGEKTKVHMLRFMPYDEVRRICLREGYVMFE